MNLQEYINEMFEYDATLLWKRAGINQAMFVRDCIHSLFSQGENNNERYFWRQEHPVRVVGTHTSKSVALPVYAIENDKVLLYMRENFFDWKISVEHKQSFGISLPDIDLYNRTQVINPIYCEGFKPEWVYGSYLQDAGKFTMEIHGDYAFWTFCYLLRNTL